MKNEPEFMTRLKKQAQGLNGRVYGVESRVELFLIALELHERGVRAEDWRKSCEIKPLRKHIWREITTILGKKQLECVRCGITRANRSVKVPRCYK